MGAVNALYGISGVLGGIALRDVNPAIFGAYRCWACAFKSRSKSRPRKIPHKSHHGPTDGTPALFFLFTGEGAHSDKNNVSCLEESVAWPVVDGALEREEVGLHDEGRVDGDALGLVDRRQQHARARLGREDLLEVELEQPLALMMLDWCEHKDIRRIAMWLDPHMLGIFVKAVLRVVSYLDIAKEAVSYTHLRAHET